MFTLALEGDLDWASAHVLEMAIERLCETGVEGITLDLAGLTSIDWTGARVIAFRSRLCQQRGFAFALVPGPAHIQRAFEATGMAGELPFVAAPRGKEASPTRAAAEGEDPHHRRLELSCG